MEVLDFTCARKTKLFPRVNVLGVTWLLFFFLLLRPNPTIGIEHTGNWPLRRRTVIINLVNTFMRTLTRSWEHKYMEKVSHTQGSHFSEWSLRGGNGNREHTIVLPLSSDPLSITERRILNLKWLQYGIQLSIEFVPLTWPQGFQLKIVPPATWKLNQLFVRK